MNTMKSIFRLALAGSFVVAIVTLYAGGRSNASTIINFDYSGNSPTAVAITGLSSGTMSFGLNLDPTGVFGNFSVDVFNNSNTLISSLAFAGAAGSAFGGVTTNNYGDVTGLSLQSEPLWNSATWSVNVGIADLPNLTLSINSTLDFIDPTFIPVLSLDLTGGLQKITTAVPEPSSWLMMLLGFASVAFVAYRKNRKLANATEIAANSCVATS